MYEIKIPNFCRRSWGFFVYLCGEILLLLMKIILFILCCIITYHSEAQSKNYTYYLNKDLVSVPKEEAIFIGQGTKKIDGFLLDCFDAVNERLVAKISFVDSTLSSYNGPYISYHKNLKEENIGNYNHNEEEGLWLKYDSLGRNTDSIVYKKGKKMNSVKRWYWNNGTVSTYQVTDSLTDTFTRTVFDSNGVKTKQFIFKGQVGEAFTFTDGNISKEPLYTREEKEAEFPGGTGAWVRYLQKNLNPSVGFKKDVRPGYYRTVIRFNIDVDGTVTDIKPETRFGYGLEEEAMRIIKNSGKWIPAKQFGKYVKAYRRQPVSFVYE